MDIVTGLLKMIFGSKADKDRKEVQPYIDRIKAVYPTIEKLTNDELRAHSAGLMRRSPTTSPTTRPASWR